MLHSYYFLNVVFVDLKLTLMALFVPGKGGSIGVLIQIVFKMTYFKPYLLFLVLATSFVDVHINLVQFQSSIYFHLVTVLDDFLKRILIIYN